MSDVRLPDLGYVFYPTEYPPVTAHSGLDVNIFSRPTEEHYDPERLTVYVVNRAGVIESTAITHPWHGKRLLRLAPGRIILADRKGKLVEAFAAGGELTLLSMTGCTCCRISSPVPLYRLADESGSEPESVATAVVDKIEALLAICRARWGVDQAGFEHRLMSIETAALYHAALASIALALEQTPSRLRGARYHEMRRGVKLAIDVAQRAGKWPTSESYLEDLLRNPNVVAVTV